MEEIELLSEDLDPETGTHVTRNRQQEQSHTPTEKCKLKACLTLCFLFILSVFLYITLICMNMACRNNPCNPYCHRSYSTKDNGTNHCEDWKKEKLGEHHLSKRWSHDNSHLKEIDKEHNHPWLNNAWYRYVYDRTHKRNGSTECYVCSHLPTTAMHATIYGIPPEIDESMCIFSKAVNGSCTKRDLHSLGLFLKSQSTREEDAIPACKGKSPCVFNLTNWNYTCNEEHWINVHASNTRTKSFAIVLKPHIQHPICFNFSHGSKKLGRNGNCTQTLDFTGSAKEGTFTLKKGTFWVQGTAWACGPKTYFMLPPNSTGLCAPILVSDHTFKITAEPHQRRQKRSTTELPPHDPIWGTDVPDQFKLWTKRQKVMLSLFPWTGTGKALLRIETLDYRFGLFLNASTKINKAQNEEIDAVRIMVMQHRVALDIILAEKGGLCVLFNTTCCTYIPDNVHSSNMTEALDVLRQLSQAQQKDYVKDTEDWLTWLFSGSWKTLIMKGLTFLGILLTLLCLFSTCVLPCIKNMINRMFTVKLQAYITLSQHEQQEEMQFEEDDF